MLECWNAYELFVVCLGKVLHVDLFVICLGKVLRGHYCESA